MSAQKEKLHVRKPVFLYDFAAGYISGVANILSGQPFDICKVRMQSQGTGSLAQTFKSIVAKEGVWKLWAGSTFPLIFYGICNSIVFAVNESCKYAFRQRSKATTLRNHEFFLSGSMAGLANSVISAPMEHIRIRLQTDKTGRYRNSFTCAADIFRQHGIRGIYKGFQITMLREFVLYGSYFAAYEILKQRFQSDNKFLLMSIGGIGGLSGWCSAFYIDNVKSKIQTDSFTNPKYPTWASLRPVLKWSELSKGFSAGFIRAYPVNAITFVVYEIAADMIYRDKK